MSVTTMDRAAAKVIDAALREAAEMVAEDLGLNVKVGGGRFDPAVGEFKPKVVFSLSGAEERAFAQVAPLFDLTAEDYGRTVTYGGKEFRLVGLSTRRPKYPVVGEARGKRFKLPDSVLAPLAR